MVNEIKTKIANAIRYAKGQLGFQLVAEDWGSTKGKCACALGCLLVQNNCDIPEDGDKASEKAAEILGVSREWVNDFITGFDDGYPSEPNEAEASRLIGAELRDEFLPVPKLDEDDEEIDLED